MNPAVALYYVSRLAKDYVKVLISGEGGDEAFAGYPTYRDMLWLERLKSRGPFEGPFFRPHLHESFPGSHKFENTRR